jgi:hypothetical protein
MNRRTFLMNSIATPGVATAATSVYVAVVGAGAFGGWTAFYLRQMALW